MVEITTTTDTHIDVTAGMYMPGDVESDTIELNVFERDYAVLRVTTPDVDGNTATVVLRNLHLDHLEELYSMIGDAIAEMEDIAAEAAEEAA